MFSLYTSKKSLIAQLASFSLTSVIFFIFSMQQHLTMFHFGE